MKMMEFANNKKEENGYCPDKLKKYIEVSELRVVSEDFRIRLSSGLAEKYDAGVYKTSIKNLTENINQIKKLGLRYPGNADPIFYVYIVPDEDFIELLQYPYKTRKGGGRPVLSYDLDGFSSAYGLSQNICANSVDNPSISKIVNDIHEFGHLVHSQFFNKDRFICEGFAETLPLYTMDYESVFDEHRNAIKRMKSNQIYSVEDLLVMARKGNFNEGVLIPDRSCSFDLSYISSYLFVRGCMEKMVDKFNISRIEATQKFLEMVRKSRCSNEWLVLDLSNDLGMSGDELLYDKRLQIETLKRISEKRKF